MSTKSSTLRTRILFLLFVLLFSVPMWVSPNQFSWDNFWAVLPHRPCVGGGDEPHYLVMVHSIVEDGDFDLRNNYVRSHEGKHDAGVLFAGYFMDHHALYALPGGSKPWVDVFDFGSEGPRWFFQPKPEYEFLRDAPEYSWHPYPFALLLAGPAFALKDWFRIEAVSLVVVSLMGLAAFGLLFDFFRRLGESPSRSVSYAALSFATTPWWHYNEVLFTEGPLAFLAMLFLWIWWRGRGQTWQVLALVPLILSTWIKPPTLLFAVPVLLLWARDQKWGRLSVSLILMLIAAGGYWGLIEWLFGHGLVQIVSARQVSWAEALPALFWGVSQGLLFSVPTLILALLAWWRPSPSIPRDLVFVTAANTALYLILLMIVHNWFGGMQYGARAFVPVLPFVSIAVWMWMKRWKTLSSVARAVTLAVVGFAIVLNGMAGLFPEIFMGIHPFTFIVQGGFGP